MKANCGATYCGVEGLLSLRLRINRGLNRMHRTGLTQMDGGDVVGIYFLPAVDVIEQLGRGTLRAHQGRLDAVLIQQPEQILRLHQSAGGIVVDEKFLTEKFGAAVDEGCEPLVCGSKRCTDA